MWYGFYCNDCGKTWESDQPIPDREWCSCGTVTEPELMDDIHRDAMEQNKRMGAALVYIYREAPEWQQKVKDYLAGYNGE